MSRVAFDDKKYTAVELQHNKWNLDIRQLSLLVDNKNVDELNELGGVEGLARRLHTDVSRGISDDSDLFHSRVAQFGANVIPEEPPTSIFRLMWEALQDPTLIILIAAACVSLPVGIFFEDPKTGWIEGTAILVSVCIVVLVASINDYQKDKQFRELNKTKNEIDIKVVRNGKSINVSVHDLVVGDLVVLETGDAIPCDGVLVKSTSLKVNESSQTGEAEEAKKSVEKNPFCIAGTQVVDGLGVMIVVAVGINSRMGRLGSMIREGDGGEETVLQKKLVSIAELIGKFGFAVASFTVIVLIVGYAIHDKVVEKKPWTTEDIPRILNFVITGLTIVVVAVPEGLPLAVTISMAFSVKKMLNDKNLVRHLDACEVMGGATTICSDKTGTLTRNKMTVVEAYLGKVELSRGSKTLNSGFPKLHKDLQQALFDNIIFNGTARISYDNPSEPNIRQDTGSKTECALLELARDFGKTKEEVMPQNFKYVVLHTFSSAKKRMSCVIEHEGKYRALVKGASEVVLDLCSQIMLDNGKIVPLSKEDKANIGSQIIQKYAKGALRTLCLAYRDMTVSDASVFENPDNVEKDLICLGIVGIEDPVRDEVPAAVEKCKHAGIVVRMVTGDNLDTAVAIAKKCGILVEGDYGITMEGPKFRATVLPDPLNPKEIDMVKFEAIAPKLRVLARSSPTDKYVLVQGLKTMGQIVAVTGDGTNDAPALALANVGLSMGIAGTEVAKEASDIIIMDDNFSSIVSAVKWGRNVFDSISKFVQFQLTVNIVAIITAVVGAFTIQESPLTAVQMLWVNLIMDTLASLALATEPPTEALLERAPYATTRSIISKDMWRNIIGQAIYQLIVLMTIIFAGADIFGVENGAHKEKPTEHFTIVFNTFVMLQVFNEINCRKIHGEVNVFEGFFRNSYFVTIIFGTMIVQFLIVQFGGLPMRTTPLGVNHWLVCIALGAGSWLVGLVLHLIPRDIFPESRGSTRSKTTQESTTLRGKSRRTHSMTTFQQLSRRTATTEKRNT